MTGNLMGSRSWRPMETFRRFRLWVMWSFSCICMKERMRASSNSTCLMTADAK